jgi:hypothetical protein
LTDWNFKYPGPARKARIGKWRNYTVRARLAADVTDHNLTVTASPALRRAIGGEALSAEVDMPSLH